MAGDFSKTLACAAAKVTTFPRRSECDDIRDAGDNPWRAGCHLLDKGKSFRRFEPRHRLLVSAIALLVFMCKAETMPLVQAQPKANNAAAPSLELRAAAMAVLQQSGGRLHPDYEKLQAAGRGEDVWNPRNEYVTATFARGKNVDEALAHLTEFPELLTVDLSGTQVTEAGLAHVGRLKNVTTLVLDSTPTTDVGLSRLVGLKNLQTLRLSKTKITDVGMQWLAQLKALLSLDLNDTAVGDQGLKSLATLNQLIQIDLRNTQTTDVGLTYVESLPHLTGLWLNGEGITDAGLSHLRPLADLKTLDLTDVPISDDALIQLDPRRKLTFLALKNSRISDASASWLGERKELTLLDLGNTALTDAGLEKLAGLTQLEVLSLAGTQITDGGLKTLEGCKKLKVLRLGNARITDAAMAPLARLKTLENLELSGTKITPAGLRQLNALTHLAKVFVTDTPLTDFEVYDALPRTNPNVQKILSALEDKTELEFQDQPLSDVVEYLRERHDMNVLLDVKSLKAAGKDAVLPVTIMVKGVSLREALNQMLAKYELAMAVRHEVLMIGGKSLSRELPVMPIVPDGEQLSPKLREALGDKTELEFVDQPLADVVKYLSERHNIKIVLDNGALTDAGVGSDRAVTLNARGITLKSGLELLLGENGLTCFAEGDRLAVRPIR